MTETPETPAEIASPPSELNESPPQKEAAAPGSAEEKLGSIGLGIGLCALLYLFQVLFLPMAGPLWIGISQLVYVVPAVLIARKKGQFETAKGLWIGAGITFLINVTCFGVVMFSLGQGGFH